MVCTSVLTKEINPALAENARAFSRLFFHARVLRPISQCDTSTNILGFKSRIPVFVSGAALAKLGHPLGEVNITRGSARAGIIQMVSSNASLSASDIAAARVSPDQPLFFQLYKRRDNEQAAERVREIEQLGYNAIFLTVDAPVAGNRERDVRAPYELEEQEREGHASDSKEGLMKPEDIESLEDDTDAGGTAGALLKLDDQDMTWEKVITILYHTSDYVAFNRLLCRLSLGYEVSRNYQLSLRVSDMSHIYLSIHMLKCSILRNSMRRRRSSRSGSRSGWNSDFESWGYGSGLN